MQVELWEGILAGMMVLGLLYFFVPGLKRSVRESPKGTAEDWKGAIIPLALVALFVFLLVVMVR